MNLKNIKNLSFIKNHIFFFTLIKQLNFENILIMNIN
jgi:hypothetical protein